MVIFEAYRALGYNYIARDEADETGRTRICAYVNKPDMFLYNEYKEVNEKYIEVSFYVFGLKNANDCFINIDDCDELKNIGEKECRNLSPDVNMDRGTVEKALKYLGFKYVTRDESGRLAAFPFMPTRIDGENDDDGIYYPGCWNQNRPEGYIGYGIIDIYNDVFSDVVWESEPYVLK